ncbi:MAG: glycosyltransferase family 9 protein [Deltaproteobacteria bacterium]|nr:glycosyltransferase family 9 protein [Deltaproteobacteria bacterium]
MRLHPVDGILYLSMRLLKAFDRRKTSLKCFDPDKVRNILVVSSTAIGDTLLSTPAIKAVRERYPDAKIIAHFNNANMEMFENNPHIDGIIPYYGGYKKFFKTVRELRKHKFDLVLIFHGNEPQATPMAYLAGAHFIVKLPNTSEYSFLLSNTTPRPPPPTSEFVHGIEQRLKVAAIVGCSSKDKRMVLPVEAEDEEAVSKFLNEQGVKDADALVGFQVGASTISRIWFADRFIELGKRLIAAYPMTKIVITGSPAEGDYCERLGKEIGDEIIVSAGKIPLKQMPALVKRFKVLITGDTGIMHIAIAVGISVVALYAVADYRITGPYYDQEKHRVIQKWKTCDPCVSKKCEYQKCMENISVDEVFDAVTDVIGVGVKL